MVAERDKRMNFDTAAERSHRADLAPLARPQGGVDAMSARFPNRKGTIAGVTDNGDASTRGLLQVTVRQP
jgi:hypothetical protein